MTRRRASGVLLHPTSLPGPLGIGDLGPAAHAWVEALARAAQRYWQVLPLGPTGTGDSPYQSFSAFAGNPNLISPELLIEDGLLDPGEIPGHRFPATRVDYGAVIRFKRQILDRAFAAFVAGRAPGLRDGFAAFCAAERRWLEDFALFMALKDAHGDGSWVGWEPGLARRSPAALGGARRRLAAAIQRQRFGQFLFFRQWQALRSHARARGVRIIGDAPIYVAHDSADVWAHRELFRLDAAGRPAVVAGVPPDAFSATGQRWGNPLYDWAALEATDFRWWIDRIRHLGRQVDLIRLDHFIGFSRSWEIPASSTTAATGRWIAVPGRALFDALTAALGALPAIAEDLGPATPRVGALRRRYGLPGMRVLQFTLTAPAGEPRPAPGGDVDTVVYTGTHDNDTARGWYSSLTARERRAVARALGGEVGPRDIGWRLIERAWASAAGLAVVPLQDVLELGSDARLNTPGTATGNWRWRFSARQLTGRRLDRLARLTLAAGRAGNPGDDPA